MLDDLPIDPSWRAHDRVSLPHSSDQRTHRPFTSSLSPVIFFSFLSPYTHSPTPPTHFSHTGTHNLPPFFQPMAGNPTSETGISCSRSTLARVLKNRLVSFMALTSQLSLPWGISLTYIISCHLSNFNIDQDK
ncbi:hypothetical protein AMECASPLE_030008 [Ameca splendens]|uniref:Uncharacterized protein n=1 Tax=Ameca splendens TaxID=208324 RepID=A0ABV0ZRV3_9TELE